MIALELPLAPLYVTHPQIVREGQPPTDVVDPGANVGSAPVPSRALASWATLDALPDVDDGAAEIDHYYNPPRVLRYGRRPLRAGDRVQIVQGPGTVVGHASVDKVLPIIGSPADCVDDVEHICAHSGDVLHHFPFNNPDADGWTERTITGHEHVNWTPGRFAVKFKDAVKA